MKPEATLRWRHRKTEVYKTPLGITVFTERERHAKKKMGRPSKMFETTLQKLREAWALGATDTEACLFAGIGDGTLYNYTKQHPELAEEARRLKELPTFQAREIVVKAIRNGDLATSQWYLERKARAEFGKTPDTIALGFDMGKLLEEVEKREARDITNAQEISQENDAKPALERSALPEPEKPR